MFVIEINIDVGFLAILEFKAVAGILWLIIIRIEAANALVVIDYDGFLDYVLADCFASSLIKLLYQKLVVIIFKFTFHELADITDQIMPEPASPLILDSGR